MCRRELYGDGRDVGGEGVEVFLYGVGVESCRGMVGLGRRGSWG